MNSFRQAFAVAMLIVAVSATAQTSTAQTGNVVVHAAPAPMVEGEVRKVDKDQGKITLKHGPIPNLDMPGMTMVFRVKDAVLLDQLQVGDKVRFAVDRVSGQLTVTAIEISR